MNDKRLSSDERALLVDLLSQPDNWKIIPSVVGHRMQWGRDKTYKVLRLLREHGYLRRIQERDSWTRSYGPVIYTVYSDFDDNPETAVKSDEPLPEIPLTENQVHIIRTNRHQEIKRTETFNDARAKSGTTFSRGNENGQNHQKLARILCPNDIARGYEMLQVAEEEEMSRLCRKLTSGTLIEGDFVQLKLKFLAQLNVGKP